MVKNGMYEYFAFSTDKGRFTLIGSCKEYDEFRELGTNNFYQWKREQIADWYSQGKIIPIPESTYLTWFEK